jgi:hypothetical protein
MSAWYVLGSPFTMKAAMHAAIFAAMRSLSS